MDHRPNVRTKTIKVYNSYNLIKRQVTQLKMGKGFEKTFLQRRYIYD